MNTRLSHLFRLGLALAGLALVSANVQARDDDEPTDGTTARVKFSDPGIPGTLKLALPWAEVRISGTDDKEVVVTSSLDQRGKKEVDRDGFRRLDEDVTFELTEKNNVASVTVTGDNVWASHGAEFDIKVPRNTNLVLRTETGGDIQVENVDGDIEVNSMNGEVQLTDIGSSAVVNTMNGEIAVSFRKAPTKAVSLSSMNGEIELRLPGDTKANLRMRTHNGSIRTNFPDGVLKAKTEKSARPALSPNASAAERRKFEKDVEKMARDQARMAQEVARNATHNMSAPKAVAESNVPEAPAAPEAVAEPEPAAAPSPDVQVHVHPNVNVNVNIPSVPAIPGFGKVIAGTINGGGVDIQLATMNGAITLRQVK